MSKRGSGSSARAGGGFKITKKERETTQGYIDQVIKKRWDSLDNVKITKTREDQINISYDAKKDQRALQNGQNECLL